MELRLYNTLTRTKDVFKPIEPGHVKLYTCGPTVYRFIHIGNLRSFMLADWLRRTLLHFGYEVKHVKNITDVGHMRQELLDRGEDKLIAAARKEGKSPLEIAAFYTQAFLEDEAKVNILGFTIAEGMGYDARIGKLFLGNWRFLQSHPSSPFRFARIGHPVGK